MLRIIVPAAGLAVPVLKDVRRSEDTDPHILNLGVW
jgi:hypothetical protein